MDSHADLQDRLNSTFVLSAALYFRLVATEGWAQDAKLAQWQAILHDTATGLGGLSESWSEAESISMQLNRGIFDLIHSLKDVAECAEQTEEVSLSARLQDQIGGLEAYIRSVDPKVR